MKAKRTTATQQDIIALQQENIRLEMKVKKLRRIVNTMEEFAKNIHLLSDKEKMKRIAVLKEHSCEVK